MEETKTNGVGGEAPLGGLALSNSTVTFEFDLNLEGPKSNDVVFMWFQNIGPEPVEIDSFGFNSMNKKMSQCNFPENELLDHADDYYCLKIGARLEVGAKLAAKLKIENKLKFEMRSRWPTGVFGITKDGQVIDINNVSEKPIYQGHFEPDNSKIPVKPIVPRPQTWMTREGSLERTTAALYLKNKTEWNTDFLSTIQKCLPNTFSFSLEVGDAATVVVILPLANLNEHDDYHELTIEREQIVIQVQSQDGLCRALSSLVQILFFYNTDLPCCTIRDWSRFQYRGSHLDVSRNFKSVPEVKKFMTVMAIYKLNKLHLHLSDNEGWRVEISKYPQLTQIGAWRGFGEKMPPSRGSGAFPSGGYYTQTQIRELVAFGETIGIQIIPEVDMPGHSKAIVNSLPELCTSNSKDYKPRLDWNVLSPALPETYEFTENTIAELSKLFPGDFLHVGGDEVSAKSWRGDPRCRELAGRLGLGHEWELFFHFLSEIEQQVGKEGKTICVWEEGSGENCRGISEKAIVYIWKLGWEKTLKRVTSQKRNVVLVPSSNCYLDQVCMRAPLEPGLTWVGYVDLPRAYCWEPLSGLSEEESSYVLGVQCALWTEMMPTMHEVEYMAFPRILATAEVGWSLPERKDWSDFEGRAAAHQLLLHKLGVNFRPKSSGWIAPRRHGVEFRYDGIHRGWGAHKESSCGK